MSSLGRRWAPTRGIACPEARGMSDDTPDPSGPLPVHVAPSSSRSDPRKATVSGRMQPSAAGFLVPAVH